MTHTEIALLNRLVDALERHPIGEWVKGREVRLALKMSGGKFAALVLLGVNTGVVSYTSDSYGRSFLALTEDYLGIISRLYATEPQRRLGRPPGLSPRTLELAHQRLEAAGWTCIPPKSTYDT
jgi:hypothetical protein